MHNLISSAWQPYSTLPLDKSLLFALGEAHSSFSRSHTGVSALWPNMPSWKNHMHLWEKQGCGRAVKTYRILQPEDKEKQSQAWQTTSIVKPWLVFAPKIILSPSCTILYPWGLCFPLWHVVSCRIHSNRGQLCEN